MAGPRPFLATEAVEPVQTVAVPLPLVVGRRAAPLWGIALLGLARAIELLSSHSPREASPEPPR
eukprot:7501194-Lingulodinium_polyedra.AAC.1